MPEARPVFYAALKSRARGLSHARRPRRGIRMAQAVYLQTYGCQMNERDSEEILGMLVAQGYAVVEREEEADVILLNTCSVRAHAEERAFGKMGLMRSGLE